MSRLFVSSVLCKIAKGRIAATDSRSAVILNKGANLFTAFILVVLLLLLPFYGEGECIKSFPSKNGLEWELLSKEFATCG